MKIIEVVKQIFKKQQPLVNPAIELRRDSFFLDKNKHAQFLENGWCTVQNVVKDEEIKTFLATFNEISKLDGFELDKNLLNSGRLFNPEIRTKTKDVINLNAKTILPRIFNMEKVADHTGGAYQVKPPHPNSDLQIHQDSTVIDEQKDYCLFVWIPFCNVNETNGPIWVLPGSHLWGNIQRSLGVPWNFLKHIDTLRKYMHPVLVKKGDIMVFDPALIHSSAPNLSTEIRHAITITVLRKNYQLVYYYKNKNGKENKIEKYDVDETFYYDYDFISKPDETKWNKTIVDYQPFDLKKSEILTLIKKYLPANYSRSFK